MRFAVLVARLCYVFMCIFAYLSRNSSTVSALGCSRFALGLSVTSTILASRRLIFIPFVCIYIYIYVTHVCVHIYITHIYNTGTHVFTHMILIQNSLYDALSQFQTRLRRLHFPAFARIMSSLRTYLILFSKNVSKSSNKKQHVSINAILYAFRIDVYVYTYIKMYIEVLIIKYLLILEALMDIKRNLFVNFLSLLFFYQ